MKPFKVNLSSAVFDLTRQSEAYLAPRYMGREFENDVIHFNLYLDKETYREFKLVLSLHSGFADGPNEILATCFTFDLEGNPVKIFTSTFVVSQVMTVLSAIKTAAHITGDYLKSAYALESEFTNA